jgi:hypothetical protein
MWCSAIVPALVGRWIQASEGKERHDEQEAKQGEYEQINSLPGGMELSLSHRTTVGRQKM